MDNVCYSIIVMGDIKDKDETTEKPTDSLEDGLTKEGLPKLKRSQTLRSRSVIR